MKYINKLIDKINGVDTDIMNKIQSGEIKVEIQDRTYIISQGDKIFHITESGGGDSICGDYSATYLYKGINLNELEPNGKDLLKIIKSYQKLIEQNKKNEHTKKAQGIKDELQNIFTQAPIVTKNNNTYTLTFGDTVFDVLQSSEGNAVDGHRTIYLYNGINLDKLGNEGKNLLQAIKNHDKSIEQNKKNEHTKKIQGLKDEIKDIFIQDPIVTKSKDTYTLTFGDTVLDVLESSEGNAVDGHRTIYLHNGINLDQLGYEGKQILKIIKKHDIK